MSPDRTRAREFVKRRARAVPAAARQVGLIACYLAAGVLATWPRASFLTAGRLPAMRDSAAYVWDLWWVAHQILHLANPWHTTAMVAPVGVQLGYDTLIPLPGLLMTPITLAFGPSASYNLLSAACPGLLCYAMYRAARLWQPTGPGAFAAGAFYGLAPELCWSSWYQVNLALGALFAPLALEAVIRLRRAGARPQATALGLVIGAALLTDLESAVLATMLTAAALLQWIALPLPPRRRVARHAAVPLPTRRSPGRVARLGLTSLAALVSLAAASPQLLNMAQQKLSSGQSLPRAIYAHFYNPSGAGLVQMFAPSPRLDSYGLHDLTVLYHEGRAVVVVVGYGLTLSVMGLLGLVVAWRRRGARSLALLWLGSSVLALGSSPWLLNRDYRPFAQRWYGVPMSAIMPYTWLVRLPGMAGFREADRFTELGLVAASTLAAAAVTWLYHRATPILAVAMAAAVLEMGWAGGQSKPGVVPPGTMPTALPALDGPIAADHSRSIVVDVPFGIRGGVPVTGGAFPPETMVLATADGHPLADGLISRIPPATLGGVERNAFYAALMRAQGGPHPNTPAQMRPAWLNARRIDIGWVLDWSSRRGVRRLLRDTGFRLAYRADGASVYRRTVACPPVACRARHRRPSRRSRTRPPAARG